MDIDETGGATSASSLKRARSASVDSPTKPKRKKADPKAPKLKKAIEVELRNAIKNCLADGRKCAARLKLVAKQAEEIGNKSLTAQAIRAATRLASNFSTVTKALGALKSVKQLLGL